MIPTPNLSNTVSFMAFVLFAALSQPPLLLALFHSPWSDAHHWAIPWLSSWALLFPIHTHFAGGLIQSHGFKYNLYANTSLIYISILVTPLLPLPQELQAHKSLPPYSASLLGCLSLTSQKSKFLLLAAKSAFPRVITSNNGNSILPMAQDKNSVSSSFHLFLLYCVFNPSRNPCSLCLPKCIHILTTSYPLCGCYLVKPLLSLAWILANWFALPTFSLFLI